MRTDVFRTKNPILESFNLFHWYWYFNSQIGKFRKHQYPSGSSMTMKWAAIENGQYISFLFNFICLSHISAGGPMTLRVALYGMGLLSCTKVTVTCRESVMMTWSKWCYIGSQWPKWNSSSFFFRTLYTPHVWGLVRRRTFRDIIYGRGLDGYAYMSQAGFELV